MKKLTTIALLLSLAGGIAYAKESRRASKDRFFERARALFLAAPTPATGSKGQPSPIRKARQEGDIERSPCGPVEALGMVCPIHDAKCGDHICPPPK